MATKTSHFMRPLVALVALVAAMAALLIAYSANPVHAAGTCTTTAGTTTCTFAPIGAEDTFVVPDGVSTVHVVATGAPGAVGRDSGSAGRGAQVSGDLTGLMAGQILYVEVGGAPTRPGTSNCFSNVDCIGGFNGGGTSRFGGGGGGASDVRTKSRDQLASLESRLIVAGGGGGSGESGLLCVSADPSGGIGGAAGSAGGDGEPCGSLVGGTGGKAGGLTAGGLGGSPSGQNGSLGQGGGGGESEGGGGGGGYYGGGGGGGTVCNCNPFFLSGAGGGGGGSSLDPDGGPTPTIATGGPSVTITYTTPADTTPPVLSVPGPITNEATSPDGAVVTFNATAEDAVDGPVDVTCTPPSGSTFPIATTEVSCSATDAAGNKSTATFFVTVRDNTAPSITAPPNITVEATSPNGAVVQYGTDAGNSCSATDIADHNPTITYSGGLPSGSTFPIGTTLIPCIATDSSGNSSTATFSVTVRDTKAPTVSCGATPNKLSLPANNHKLVGITTTVQVTDSGSGPNGFKLVSVKSSQPDSGLGPDDVAGDMPNWTTGTADTSGQLRAERYGKDRVYTLNYEGYDKAGNKATCSATVTVPKKGG